MNLSNLKYVVEVEKTGSITRAAQNFFMNQPHLSRMIRELEKELGFQVFERTGRGMIPTQKGEQFLHYAKVILAQEEQIEALRQNSGSQALTIRLAAPRTSYLPLALALLVRESKTKAPLKISFRETNPRQVIRDVSAKDFDLGLLRCQELYLPFYQKMLQEENLESQMVWTFSCQVVFSSSHPLAQRENLTYLDLKPYVLAAFGDGPLPDFSFDGAQEADSSGISDNTLSVYDRASQLELLCRIPGAYMWDSPIPREILKTLSLVQKPCSCPGNRYCDLLIWRNNYRFSAEEQNLVCCLRRIVSQLS